jgi:hypothetical protein
MRNSESSNRRSDSAGLVPIGREMRVHRRLEKLEQALKVSAGVRHVIHIKYIDNDGRVTGTRVSSNDPALSVPYREIEDHERQLSEA